MNDRFKMTGLSSLYWLSLWLLGLGILLNYAMRWWPGDYVRSVRIIGYTMPWLLAILVPGVVVAWLAHHRWLAATLFAPILIICLTYLPLFLNCSQVAATDSSALKVMSYNVWGHNRNLAAAAALIRREQPDILLLQEINPDHFQYLAKDIEDLYLYKRLQLDYVPEINLAIISRFPITPIGADIEKGRTQKVHIETSFGIVTVINVHIHNFPWLRRHGQLITLIEEDIVNSQGPVILGGDFNTTDQAQAYKTVIRYLKNAHEESGCGFGFTFPTPVRRKKGSFPWPAMMRIDHIFYSKHFSSKNAKTLENGGGSDHYPVIAEIIPKKNQSAEYQWGSALAATLQFNQKNSSELCYGVKNKEGVGVEGETTCPLPIQNRFSNPFDTSQLCCGEVHSEKLN